MVAFAAVLLCNVHLLTMSAMMISRPTCTHVLLQGDTTLREIADFIANKKFAKVGEVAPVPDAGSLLQVKPVMLGKLLGACVLCSNE
jgi:hypothetical protein